MNPLFVLLPLVNRCSNKKGWLHVKVWLVLWFCNLEENSTCSIRRSPRPRKYQLVFLARDRGCTFVKTKSDLWWVGQKIYYAWIPLNCHLTDRSTLLINQLAWLSTVDRLISAWLTFDALTLLRDIMQEDPFHSSAYSRYLDLQTDYFMC